MGASAAKPREAISAEIHKQMSRLEHFIAMILHSPQRASHWWCIHRSVCVRRNFAAGPGLKWRIHKKQCMRHPCKKSQTLSLGCFFGLSTVNC